MSAMAYQTTDSTVFVQKFVQTKNEVALNIETPYYWPFCEADPAVTGGFFTDNQGAVSIRKTVLPGMAIPMLKIRRPNGRLIFNMEIAIRR